MPGSASRSRGVSNDPSPVVKLASQLLGASARTLTVPMVSNHSFQALAFRVARAEQAADRAHFRSEGRACNTAGLEDSVEDLDVLERDIGAPRAEVGVGG
eukprot:6984128-Heterocapsa_arctica.AAC.1